VRYLSLKHHGAAAGVFGSSGQSKAERNDWALVLRIECAAREQAVADLSKDNSSFGIEALFLATLVATLKLRANQVQAASSLVFSALDYPALVSVRALSPASFAMSESRTKLTRLQCALLSLDRMRNFVTGLGARIPQQRPPVLFLAR